MKTTIAVIALLMTSQSFAADVVQTKQQALNIATAELALTIKSNSKSLNEFKTISFKRTNLSLTQTDDKKAKSDLLVKHSELAE